MDTIVKLEKVDSSTQTEWTLKSFVNYLFSDVKRSITVEPMSKDNDEEHKKSYTTNSAPKRILPVQPLPKIKDEDRQPTDKNWSSLFIIVMALCMISWLNASVDEDYNYKHPSDNNKVTFNAPQFVPDVTDVKIIPLYNTNTKNYTEFPEHEEDETIKPKNVKANKDEETTWAEWFQFLFDIFTCNPSHIIAHNDKWEGFAVGAHTIASIFLILAGFGGVISDDKILSKQPLVVGSVFLFIVIIEHSLIVPINEILSSCLFSHYKLAYWLLPEALVFFIFLSLLVPINRYKNSENLISILQNVGNDDSISDNESHKSLVVDLSESGSVKDLDKSFDHMVNRSLKVYRMIPFYYYIHAIIFGFPFVITLVAIIISSTNVVFKADWTSVYTYIIAGGSFYIIRTIYYFSSMLTACATNIMIDSQNFTLENLKRTVVMVSRYHFGTACYHATPLIASSRAVGIMEEYGIKPSSTKCQPVTRKYDEYSRLTRTITAVRGHKYSDSVRELFRIITTTRMHEYFSSFGELSVLLYMILLPSNNLLNILQWYHGSYDADFAKQSWMMYITILFTFYFAMQFFRTVSDTIGLRLYDKRMEEKSASFANESRPKVLEYYV